MTYIIITQVAVKIIRVDPNKKEEMVKMIRVEFSDFYLPRYIAWLNTLR